MESTRAPQSKQHRREADADASTPVRNAQDLRTYVLDTSVLLSDPRAFFRFAEHTVVMPVVVITELEAKRHDPEIGYFARQALRILDELRIEHERLDFPDPGRRRRHAAGGAQPLEPVGAAERPAARRQRHRASSPCAVNLAKDGVDVTVVSKDLPMRVKAASLGLDAEEYLAELARRLRLDRAWPRLDVSGRTTWPSSTSTRSMTTRRGRGHAREHRARHPLRARLGARPSGGRAARSSSCAATATSSACTAARPSSGIAIDLLLDPEVGILSLGGRAGTGKSALALCAGLEMVLERQQHKKIMVFRPLYAVGGQELGYLPGDQGEKMNPWGQAVFDTLGSVVSDNVLEEVVDRGILEVLPLTHIRGRSLHDAFVIVDEAQSLERNVLLTVLSRIGQNSRVVLTHDVAQRDNLRVGRHDGVASVIETLKGHPLFAHITLTRSRALGDRGTRLRDARRGRADLRWEPARAAHRLGGVERGVVRSRSPRDDDRIRVGFRLRVLRCRSRVVR